jgi:hypothetical protein
MTSIPSVNFTPRMSFGNWLWPSLLSDTAYPSFIGEVEALNTTTIRRLTSSSRHQLLAIALKDNNQANQSTVRDANEWDPKSENPVARGLGTPTTEATTNKHTPLIP